MAGHQIAEIVHRRQGDGRNVQSERGGGGQLARVTRHLHRAVTVAVVVVVGILHCLQRHGRHGLALTGQNSLD